jgi:hypothetical protein
MNYKKRRKAAISKTDPLMLILRNFCSVRGDRKLSHATWLENHRSGVIAAGRVLQFLGLADLDELSGIGWKAKPLFFRFAKEAKPLYVAPQDGGCEELEFTNEDSVLIDMLSGIATQLYSMMT